MRSSNSRRSRCSLEGSVTATSSPADGDPPTIKSPSSAIRSRSRESGAPAGRGQWRREAVATRKQRDVDTALFTLSAKAGLT